MSHWDSFSLLAGPQTPVCLDLYWKCLGEAGMGTTRIVYIEASRVVHRASSRRKKYSTEERHAFRIQMPIQACICPSLFGEESLLHKVLPLDVSLGHGTNGVLKVCFMYLGIFVLHGKMKYKVGEEEIRKKGFSVSCPLAYVTQLHSESPGPEAQNPKSFLSNCNFPSLKLFL